MHHIHHFFHFIHFPLLTNTSTYQHISLIIHVHNDLEMSKKSLKYFIKGLKI